MADVLKGTLWWASNPTFTVTAVSGTGNENRSRAMTAAEAHDASDATYEGLNDIGDSIDLEGNAYSEGGVALIAAPAGGIKFVRVKFRARVAVSSGAGTVTGQVTPRINGVLRGSPQELTASFANYQQDFSTDPADGLAWTPAKIDAQAWGMRLAGQTSDPGVFATGFEVRVAEFTVEVWGEDVTVSPAGASASGDANASESVGGTAVLDTGSRDPSTVTAQLTTLDQQGAPVTVRSFKASLNDQTLATKDAFTSPASWPNGATELQPLYGAASQGLQGSSGGGNGINGVGPISGVKLFALVRVSKSAASSITDIRFGTAMGVKSLVQPPTIRDFEAGLDDTMWEVVETALITTGQFGQPFTWGNGVDSVWASLFGWTFNHTYSNPANPNTTQVEVAEAWVEVHGPLGSEPEFIELKQVFGDVVKRFTMTPEV